MNCRARRAPQRWPPAAFRIHTHGRAHRRAARTRFPSGLRYLQSPSTPPPCPPLRPFFPRRGPCGVLEPELLQRREGRDAGGEGGGGGVADPIAFRPFPIPIESAGQFARGQVGLVRRNVIFLISRGGRTEGWGDREAPTLPHFSHKTSQQGPYPARPGPDCAPPPPPPLLTRTHKRAPTHAHTHTHTHTHTLTQTCAYTHSHTHTYALTHLHTHKHTHSTSTPPPSTSSLSYDTPTPFTPFLPPHPPRDPSESPGSVRRISSPLLHFRSPPLPETPARAGRRT